MTLQALMIDSREPVEIQRLDFGVPAVVTALECGDLWASCADGELLIIERKTPSDLLASIGDNRLFLQAQKMRERSKWAYLVITGWLTPTHDNKTFVNNRLTGWNWDSVQGALLSVQEAGVNIAYCADDHQYPETVQWLAKRQRGAKVLAPAEHSTRVMSPAERVLTGLPGIGLERAQDLLENHLSAAHALAWLTWTDTFGEVAGIGNGIKTQVRRALGLADGQELTIWSDEARRYAKECADAQKETTYEQHNGAGNAPAVEPVHLGNDSGSGAGDEGQPAFWGQHGSTGRGDYGQRL